MPGDLAELKETVGDKWPKGYVGIYLHKNSENKQKWIETESSYVQSRHIKDGTKLPIDTTLVHSKPKEGGAWVRFRASKYAEKHDVISGTIGICVSSHLDERAHRYWSSVWFSGKDTPIDVKTYKLERVVQWQAGDRVVIAPTVKVLAKGGGDALRGKEGVVKEFVKVQFGERKRDGCVVTFCGDDVTVLAGEIVPLRA
jgi:hypothetical protein